MPIAYPYRMSDWYGYDKDCSSVTAFNTTGIARNACNFNSSDRTFYHDGSGTYPTTGDIVYSNSAGTTKVSGGERRWFNSVLLVLLSSTPAKSQRNFCPADA